MIPKVVEVDTKKRRRGARRFVFPKACPECGAKVVKPEDEVDYRCPNLSCPRQLKRSLEHFARRTAMDIEGLGEMLVEQLVERRLITDVSDLYKLDLLLLAGLERIGLKSAQNLLDAIAGSRDRELHRLVFGLGLRNVGEHAAGILARRFRTMDRLVSASFEELEAIHEIGPIMAKSIVDFFHSSENLEVIRKLVEAGLNMEEREVPDMEEGHPFDGKTFVLTGTLSAMPRDEAGEMIRRKGGRVSSSVSGKTDYVVIGESPGSKLEKAKKLGVKTIEEKDFLKMIGGME